MSPRKKASCPTYYVGESESINGRSRITRQTYLGTAWLVRDKASAVPFQARLAANGIRLTAKQHSFKGSRGIPAQRPVFCASGCGCSCGCLAGPPFAGGFPGEAREGAVRALSLAARGDAGEDPLDGLAQHGGVLQEQPFQVPRHGAQAALEVRLHRRLARVGPEALLAAVGEQQGQGDQTEVGERLLLDRVLGLAVELLHRQQLLGNLVQLLDAPAAVVQVGEVPHAVALPVQQGEVALFSWTPKIAWIGRGCSLERWG